jgi:hypothetical protein
LQFLRRVSLSEWFVIDCLAWSDWPFLQNPILSLAVPFELHFRVEITLQVVIFRSRHFDDPTHGVQIGVRAGVGNDLSDEALCSNRTRVKIMVGVRPINSGFIPIISYFRVVDSNLLDLFQRFSQFLD